MEIDIDTNAIGQNFVKLTNIVDDMLNTKLGIIDLYLENNQTLSENFLELQLNQFILINSLKKLNFLIYLINMLFYLVKMIIMNLCY